MRLHVIQALMRRSFRATFSDKGRVTELVVFPVSFLVIWGLFFASGIIDRVLAGQLLVINLIWSIAGTFQTQANLTLMFDLWAREFAHILRQGVKIQEMVAAQLIFSSVLGIINLFIFIFFVVFIFGGTEKEVMLLIELFPLYYISAIGLAALFGGMVIMLGRTYGFIAWTGLQILIMISSPFSPLETLPSSVRLISYVSPFTYIFEYVRTQNLNLYWTGLCASLMYLLFGCLFAIYFYQKRRRSQGLMDV